MKVRFTRLMVNRTKRTKIKNVVKVRSAREIKVREWFSGLRYKIKFNVPKSTKGGLNSIKKQLCVKLISLTVATSLTFTVVAVITADYGIKKSTGDMLYEYSKTVAKSIDDYIEKEKTLAKILSYNELLVSKDSSIMKKVNTVGYIRDIYMVTNLGTY